MVEQADRQPEDWPIVPLHPGVLEKQGENRNQQNDPQSTFYARCRFTQNFPSGILNDDNTHAVASVTARFLSRIRQPPRARAVRAPSGYSKWSPAHTGFDPSPRRSDPTHKAVARCGSEPVRSRRRFASHAPRWRRPAWSAPHVRENPYGRACRPAITDTLLCRANYPGKSVGQRPSTDTGSNKRSLAVEYPRRTEPHNAETHDPAGNSSTGRKRFGPDSHTIVARPRVGVCSQPPFKSRQAKSPLNSQ